MRWFLCLVTSLTLGWLAFAAQTATPATKKAPAKKSAAKKSATKKSGARKSAAKPGAASTTTAQKKPAGPARTTASKRGKKGTTRRTTTWRNRQLAPTPDRYKQIQEALSAKGYLAAGQANGTWNDASSSALKKFQADQNIEANGKINSLSLIALGLGPKRDVGALPKPAAAPAP